MIGAMPAVAVRHERRRQEKRHKRPSLLYLQSPHSRSGSPSPLQSPPAEDLQPPSEIYLCGKVSVLHIVVVSLLLGAVLLIVGLVQLKPGAGASQHRWMLLGSGGFLLLSGVGLAIVRCCILTWRPNRQPYQLNTVLHQQQPQSQPPTSDRRESVAQFPSATSPQLTTSQALSLAAP